MNEEIQQKDNIIKISKFYNSRDIRRFLNYFEFFADIAGDPNNSEDKRKAAKTCMEHYRRMVICIMMNPIEDGFKSLDLLDLNSVLMMLKNDDKKDKQ